MIIFFTEGVTCHALLGWYLLESWEVYNHIQFWQGKYLNWKGTMVNSSYGISHSSSSMLRTCIPRCFNRNSMRFWITSIGTPGLATSEVSSENPTGHIIQKINTSGASDIQPGGLKPTILAWMVVASVWHPKLQKIDHSIVSLSDINSMIFPALRFVEVLCILDLFLILNLMIARDNALDFHTWTWLQTSIQSIKCYLGRCDWLRKALHIKRLVTWHSPP